MLEISTQVEPLAARRKFLGLVNNCRGAKRQNAALVNEKRGLEEAAEESAMEIQALKQEVRRLKEELNTARRQGIGSQQMSWTEGTLASRNGGEAIPFTPQKRLWDQSSGGGEEAGGSSDRPVRRARTDSGGVSREKIRDVLGGSDRGWGSTMSRIGVGCEYHTLLDTAAHLFEQAVSREQDIAQAVFGFGPDDEVISGTFVFPLFVRNTNESPSQLTYLGNYIAIRLDPVPWEELSNTAKEYAVKIVRFKGWSTDPSLQKSEKDMEVGAILRKFCEGEYLVPRSRLEFQHFDDDLIAKIQVSPGRRRRPEP